MLAVLDFAVPILPEYIHFQEPFIRNHLTGHWSLGADANWACLSNCSNPVSLERGTVASEVNDIGGRVKGVYKIRLYRRLESTGKVEVWHTSANTRSGVINFDPPCQAQSDSQGSDFSSE
jgi:hypothetical protein